MANDDIFLENDVIIDAEIDGVIVIHSGDAKVYYATTAVWNSQPDRLSEAGSLYVYSDYTQDEHQQNIPAVKVGDGLAYIVDLPFTSDILYDHVRNQVIHVTQADKDKWNAKVRCYMDGENNLVFTTD